METALLCPTPLVKERIGASCAISMVQILLTDTSFFTSQCSEIIKITNVNHLSLYLFLKVLGQQGIPYRSCYIFPLVISNETRYNVKPVAPWLFLDVLI